MTASNSNLWAWAATAGGIPRATKTYLPRAETLRKQSPNPLRDGRMPEKLKL